MFVPAGAGEEVPVLLAEEKSKVADRKDLSNPAPLLLLDLRQRCEREPHLCVHIPDYDEKIRTSEKIRTRAHHKVPIANRNSYNY
jgi:hypothetical protein